MEHQLRFSINTIIFIFFKNKFSHKNFTKEKQINCTSEVKRKVSFVRQVYISEWRSETVSLVELYYYYYYLLPLYMD